MKLDEGFPNQNQFLSEYPSLFFILKACRIEFAFDCQNI